MQKVVKRVGDPKLETNKFIVTVKNTEILLLVKGERDSSIFGSPKALVAHLEDEQYEEAEINCVQKFLYGEWMHSLKDDPKDREFGSLTGVINQLAKDLKVQYDKEVLASVDLGEIYKRCLDMIPCSQAWSDAVDERRNLIYDELVEDISSEVEKGVIDIIHCKLEDSGQVDNLKCDFYDEATMNKYTVQEWADHLGITHDEAFEPNIKYILENGIVVFNDGSRRIGG